MYILIVGAGKVGWNLARELVDKGNEVTVVESNRRRYEVVEEELSTRSSTATAPSCGCSIAPGSSVRTSSSQ